MAEGIDGNIPNKSYNLKQFAQRHGRLGAQKVPLFEDVRQRSALLDDFTELFLRVNNPVHELRLVLVADPESTICLRRVVFLRNDKLSSFSLDML